MCVSVLQRGSVAEHGIHHPTPERGLCWTYKIPEGPARVFVTDGYTIAGKQHQDVPSRQVFDGILALLPEDMVDNAVNTFAFMSKAAVSRYFTCRNKWIKKEIKYTEELRKKTEELKVISEKSVNLVEKAKAAVQD